MQDRSLVLDANILIRAILGHRVRNILERHVADFVFFVPDLAYSEAEKHLVTLVLRRDGNPDSALAALRSVAALTTIVDRDTYGLFEAESRRRLRKRDVDDWPILAAALALGCPIWTEDADFFGCGVATWTSTNIEVFLQR